MHPDEPRIAKKERRHQRGCQNNCKGKDEDGDIQPCQDQRSRRKNQEAARIADKHGVEEIAGLALVLDAAEGTVGVHAEERGENLALQTDGTVLKEESPEAMDRVAHNEIIIQDNKR